MRTEHSDWLPKLAVWLDRNGSVLFLLTLAVMIGFAGFVLAAFS